MKILMKHCYSIVCLAYASGKEEHPVAICIRWRVLDSIEKKAIRRERELNHG